MAKLVSTPDIVEDQENASSVDVAITEDDEESLDRRTGDARTSLILYDIVYSPSYQVPVLYIRFTDFFNKENGSRMPTLDQVYDLLVPAAQRAAMQQVGVMGALSLADHPMFNLPAYFVHPCRTSEVMARMTEGRRARPIDYLLIWIGLIGASIGLTAPVKVAQKITASTE